MVRDEYNHSRPVSALIRDWLLYNKAGGGGGILKTVTGNPISVSDALAAPIKSLSVSLSPIQAGSGDPYPAGGGKNKFNGTFLQGYWAYADGKWVNSPNWITTEKIPCKASTSYTVSADAKATRWQGFVWYDSNGDFISTDNLNSNVNIGLTKTSPSNAAYLIFNIAGYPGTNDTIAPSDVTHFQLEEGSSSTAYAPYSNICPINGWTGANVYHSGADTSDVTTYSITFPSEAGTVYGGTLDVTTGLLTVNWAKIVLNGTQQISRENWKPQANSVGWIYPYDLTRNVVGTGAVMQNIKCDTLPSMPFNSLQSINGPGIALASNQTYGISVMYPNTTLTTASAINAFLAEHPIDVVYELATPQTITLDPATLSTLKGDNNVWSDGDDISMTYKAASS